jgi:tRNA(Ile)-lysidine synthase
MHSLPRRVRRTIRLRGLIGEGDRVAVALSGGPDSVGLACVLRVLEAKASWRLAGLIHVNHGLRGPESDGDEAFCRALATRLGLPVEVVSVDVRGRVRDHRQSIEAAARVERYQAFEAAAGALDATLVATGHTRDDQAETVLLRLFRGAGGRGLSAIRPRRGIYVRPLIDTRRPEVLSFLVELGQDWRDDSSNLDMAIPRNRLRHTLLPAIARDWPGGVAALARFAELAADDEQFLADTAAEVRPAVALPGPRGVQVIDVRGLNPLPPALSRRIVRGAIEASGGWASFRDVEAVRRLARADKPLGHLDLDRVTVERTGAALRFFGHQAAVVGVRAFEYPLSVPGRAEIAETGAVVLASFSRGTTGTPLSGDGGTKAMLQAAAVTPPFVVRNRRPGDRIHPFGAPGSRKLQDVLVDRKVPRDQRDAVPLVVDGEGRIVWVVGVTIAEPCRVTAPERGMVILETTKGNQ